MGSSSELPIISYIKPYWYYSSVALFIFLQQMVLKIAPTLLTMPLLADLPAGSTVMDYGRFNFASIVLSSVQ